jgi:YfiR/HmsC-like
VNATRILRIVSVLFVGVLISLFLSSARAAQLDEAAADRVRAAYILKFLEYVQWPEALFSDAAAPFVIGVNGAEYVANELARLAPTRTSGGRPIVIKRMANDAAPAEVNALYIGRKDPGGGARLVKSYAGKPVLIITDDDATAPKGSIINFVTLDGRVRFEISLAAAEQAGLKLSSRLLSVAVRVYRGQLPGDSDVATAPRPGHAPTS